MNIWGIEFMRAVWGALLLAAPNHVLISVRVVRVDRKSLIVARILGARHIVQAILSGLNPSPEMLAAGVWVDTVHSITALGLAVVDRRRIRGGVTDAIVAALWAELGRRRLHTTTDRTAPIRGRDQLAYAVVGNLPGGRGLMARARSARGDGT